MPEKGYLTLFSLPDQTYFHPREQSGISTRDYDHPAGGCGWRHADPVSVCGQDCRLGRHAGVALRGVYQYGDSAIGPLSHPATALVCRTVKAAGSLPEPGGRREGGQTGGSGTLFFCETIRGGGDGRLEVTPLRFNQSEIIEDILEHIRQGGGEFSDWCVGSAKDSQCASFGRHVNEDSKDGLLYREAYTTYAAEEVLERLVKGCGLRPERTAVPQPGRIVFVYRPRESMNIEGSGQWAEGSRRRKSKNGQEETLFVRYPFLSQPSWVESGR